MMDSFSTIAAMAFLDACHARNINPVDAAFGKIPDDLFDAVLRDVELAKCRSAPLTSAIKDQ